MYSNMQVLNLKVSILSVKTSSFDHAKVGGQTIIENVTDICIPKHDGY